MRETLKIYEKTQRKECERLLANYRKIVCFYANPKLPREFQLLSLNALTREMRYIIHSFSPINFHIEPATTQENIKESLQLYKPDIIAFSAHTWSGNIMLETGNGQLDPITSEQFTNIIKESTKQHVPSCILLLACDTKLFAEKLSKEFPQTCILFWSSVKVEDRAAQLFTQLFFENLNTKIQEDITIQDYIKFWENSLESFKEKFHIQDPEDYIKNGVTPPPEVRGVPAYIIDGTIVNAEVTYPLSPLKVNESNQPPKIMRTKTSSVHSPIGKVRKRLF